MFDWPPPPHVSGAAQLPQSSGIAPQPGPPHVNANIPQLKPSWAQFSGEHSHVPH
jgi:hypothetical protein